MTWLGTVSGRKIDFLDPDPDQICIEDIATGLAHMSRFAGQTIAPYSVAQHSVYCSVYCKTHPFEALMHDAAEAYMGDCPRPLKNLLGESWREIESRMLATILTKFGLQPTVPPEVKDVDDRMLFTERRDVQPDHMPWSWRRQPYLWRVKPWPAKFARSKFLKRFEFLKESHVDNRATACIT